MFWCTGRGETDDIIPSHLVCLAPCTHDKRIVVRNDYHDVDSSGFELVFVFDEAGEMARGTARCEGACQIQRWRLAIDCTAAMSSISSIVPRRPRTVLGRRQ